MDPGHMRRVEKIVNHVEIMAGDIHAAAGRSSPSRVVIVRDVNDLHRIRLVGVPHPYPQQAPSVLDRIGSDPYTGWWWSVLRRRPDAGAAAIEGQAVITAFDRRTHQASFRQRKLAVRAGVLEGGRITVLGSEEDDRLVEYSKRREAMREVAAPSGNIPAVPDEFGFYVHHQFDAVIRVRAPPARRGMRLPLQGCPQARVLSLRTFPDEVSRSPTAQHRRC